MKSILCVSIIILLTAANTHAGGKLLLQRVQELEEMIEGIETIEVRPLNITTPAGQGESRNKAKRHRNNLKHVNSRKTAKPYYRESIIHAANQYQVDPLLITAIIRVESGFNPNAVSYKGAMGLMQLMPGTARDMGVNRPFDPHQNIMGGVGYFRMMYDRFGNKRDALIAYNCGPNRVHSGRIPGESISYANQVMAHYKMIQKMRI